MKKPLIFLFLSFLFVFQIKAQQIPFQGYYEETNVPVTGVRDINFEITRYGWSELHTAVAIDKGLYSIILGSISNLPDSIFYQVDFEDVNITIGGTLIGTFQLYKPVGGNFSAQNGGNVQINNPSGKLRADLNYFAPNDAGSLVIYGANDSTKAILGTSTGGYNGALFLYDSLRNSNVSLRGNNNGGGLQLSYREAGLLRSAVSTGASTYGSYMNLYGANPAIDGVSLMIENYITANQIQNGPLMSGNYRRSGTDWKDNNGQILAAIGNSRDEGGLDPTGHSGYLSLWGTNTFNAHLTGKRWENNDFPLLELFGNNDDGGTFWMSNAALEVVAGAGTDNLANFRLSNTDNGGVSSGGLFLTSNLFGSGGGGIELRDAVGTVTTILEARGNGNSGQLKIRGTNGLDIAAVQNRGGNSGQAVFYGPTQGLRAEIGSFGDDSGFLITYGANGGKNVQLDRDPGNTNLGQFTLFNEDGSTSIFATAATNGTDRWGNLEISGPAGNIFNDGLTGEILANAFNLPSDRRFKKEIYTLENALENTLKLRGTSYYWKDKNKSQNRQIGVIAQELEEVYPEVVHTNEEGFKSVNYALLTAVLIEAIKELNTKVTDLESENGSLKASLEDTGALNARLERVEKLLLIQAEQQSN